MWWLVLVLAAITGIVVWAILKDKKEKKEIEEAEKEAKEATEAEKYLRFLQSGTFPSTPRPVPPVPQKKDEKSLDRQYAEQTGMWICPYCETLNVNSSAYCAACGSNRT